MKGRELKIYVIEENRVNLFSCVCKFWNENLIKIKHYYVLVRLYLINYYNNIFGTFKYYTSA